LINSTPGDYFVFELSWGEWWRVPDAPQSIVEAKLPLTYIELIFFSFRKINVLYEFNNYI
jgi:hypothetical protein